jgi:hypothetical protein
VQKNDVFNIYAQTGYVAPSHAFPHSFSNPPLPLPPPLFLSLSMLRCTTPSYMQ